MAAPEIGAARRWQMLGLGLFASTCSAMFVYGAAFLIPALQHERGLSLSQAGAVVAMPTVGLVLALIAWGILVDRFGERLALIVGSAMLGLGAVAAAAVASWTPALAVALVIGGVGAAASNGASGRLIVGWFTDRQRGLAMGIRQAAQPLGVALGAVTIPRIAHTWGVAAALLVPAALAGLAAVGCWIGVINPPRPAAKDAGALLENPYRKGSTLWRIHVVSVMLVVPQATIWTFAFVWLHSGHGWSLAAAGAVVTIAQLLGALGRIGAGVWSDRVGSRMRPLRTVSIAAAVVMVALAVTDHLHWSIAIVIMVAAAVISVADNGLAFTAVAELAGPYWSGRGLGIQNTGQNLAASLLPPAFGALITASGYPTAFLVAGGIAALAIPLVPRRDTLNAF